MATDDTALLRAYANTGDERAFETLVAQYVNLVYAAAIRQTGDCSLAEEITQTVFILLARKARSLGPDTILPSWLHRAAVFASADALKSARRRQRREQEAHMRLSADEPENETWRRIAPMLDTAIAALSAPDRHAIILRYFENKNHREVGAALGSSEDAAKMRVARALEKLRRSLAKYGVVSSAALIAETMSAHASQVAPATLARSAAAAALAHAAAAPAIFTLKGVFTLMASSTAKTAVVAAVVAGLGLALLSEHQALARFAAERDALRQQLAQAQSAAQASRDAADKARRASDQTSPPGKTSVSGAGATPLWVRIQMADPKLRPEQLDSYLAANHRNASSLLAGFRTTHDESFLREAMEKFPHDPQVAFEAVMDTNLPSADKRQWLDSLKAAPDNALGDYLSASAYFHSGQPDLALQDLSDAAGKRLDDYTTSRVQDDIEAYLATGMPLAEAVGLGTSQLLLPQLLQFKQLGGQILDLANSYSQAGDQNSLEAALQSAAALGQQYAVPSAGEAAISQLVGIAIETKALQQMDPASAYNDDGQTVQNRLDQLQQQRADVSALSIETTKLFPTISDDDYVMYKDRWLMFGEQNAEQWLVNKYASR